LLRQTFRVREREHRIILSKERERRRRTVQLLEREHQTNLLKVLELEHQTNRRRALERLHRIIPWQALEQRAPQTNQQVRLWQLQLVHRIQRRVLLLREQQLKHQRETFVVRPVWRVLQTQQEQQLENQREVRLVLRVCSLRWRRIQSS